MIEHQTPSLDVRPLEDLDSEFLRVAGREAVALHRRRRRRVAIAAIGALLIVPAGFAVGQGGWDPEPVDLNNDGVITLQEAEAVLTPAEVNELRGARADESAAREAAAADRQDQAASDGP